MHPTDNKTPHRPKVLLDIARRLGTPTYVYDESIIRRQCNTLKHHLSGIPTRLLYAMKANSHPALLQIIRSEGFGIDAVSPGELHLALAAGFKPQDILYTANNITDEEMHLVHREGVLLNLGEHSRLERFGASFPGSDVCIRLNPQIGSGHHAHVVTAGKSTKFGIPVHEINAVLNIARRYDLRIVGVHQHIGSGIPSMNTLRDAIDVLLNHAGHFSDLQFINVGGGFNIPYHPEDIPLDFENFETTIVSLLHQRYPSLSTGELVYWFEPGRFLVAEAGTLLVRANTIKSSNGHTFAGTDSGMGQLVRPAFYEAYHEIYNLSRPTDQRVPYEVVGNICESGDVFAKNRPIQTIQEGDILAIMDAGAYGMSMASVYNLRPLPAEVLILPDGSFQEIQKRQTAQELIHSRYSHFFSD